MDVIYFILAFIAGLCMAVQGPMNNGLTTNFGRHPFTTVSLVFFTGSLFLAVIALVTGVPLPSWEGQTTVWWNWLGGALGACYVASITLATPQVGVAFTMSLVLLGRVAFSVAIDQFGLVGAATREATWPRLLGIGIVLIGVLLVSRQKPAKEVPGTADESAK